MSYEEYCEALKKHGYRIKENLTFLNTPYGLWIQKITECADGFGLISVLNPCQLGGEKPCFKLTETGRRNASRYIKELSAKKKEILDAQKDTAEETSLPDLEVIEEDINFLGIDDEGEYINGWAVTDNFDADSPLLLKIGRDFEVAVINPPGVIELN